MRKLVFMGLLLLTGCGVPAQPDGGLPYVATQTRRLGLNDVTWLLPLEPLDAGSPFPAAEALLPFASVNRLTGAAPVVRTELWRLRVVAVRFDLCDRAAPVPCAEDADAVLRVVLQPVFQGALPRVEDVAFHGFFPVPRADVPALVDELRALAARQDRPLAAPLQVNAAFLTDADYRARLGALVGRYASSASLVRLTLFGQQSEVAAVQWVFRGEELRDGALQPIAIPGVAGTQQEVAVFGDTSYVVTPLADAPQGFARTVLESDFRGSPAPEQLQSVLSLLAVDDPAQHTSSTVQCLSCHASTTLLKPRAAAAGLEVEALSPRFTAPDFDLTPLGDTTTRERTLRALGYFGDSPLVSQRVVNETANVLGELERRFPPAAP